MFIFSLLVFKFLISQDINCPTESSLSSRSIYSTGDTLSIEDQNILFPVCNGSENYATGDSFSFSDLNGQVNGENYKLTLISMNATW